MSSEPSSTSSTNTDSGAGGNLEGNNSNVADNHIASPRVSCRVLEVLFLAVTFSILFVVYMIPTIYFVNPPLKFPQVRSLVQ